MRLAEAAARSAAQEAVSRNAGEFEDAGVLVGPWLGRDRVAASRDSASYTCSVQGLVPTFLADLVFGDGGVVSMEVNGTEGSAILRVVEGD